jgi:hypothetical protein
MKRYRTLAIACAILTLGALDALAADIRELFGASSCWDQSADTFMRGNVGQSFRWLSATGRDAARCPPENALQCFGMRVWEAVVRFEADRPRSLEVSLYNRGDAGDLSEEAFAILVAKIRQALDQHVGGDGGMLPLQRVAGKAKLERCAWNKSGNQFVLKWSSTGKRGEFRAEYVLLEITPYDAKADPLKARSSALVQTRSGMLTPAELKAKVTRKDDGTVYIADVPMVDQGQKGYCAVATAERILRHYGTDVDQHIVAQLADSSATLGTNPEHMLAMLKKAGTQFGVKVKVLYGLEFRKLLDEFRAYNKFARKAGKPEIGIPGGRMIIISDLYANLDPATYRQFRTEKLRREYETFQRDIQKYVDQGVPLAWSVHLGMFPEPELAQASGGHMRLIIGYDAQNGKIVYSDSWGPRHDYKTMPMDQAWTITSSLSVMTTRKGN